jgi:amino acid transporter
MNAVVNIFHLRKTFCGNTLVKSDENKWKTFLKYSLFSWGVPVIITIVDIVLVKKDVLRFQVDSTGCVNRLNNSDWFTGMEQYGLPGCLFLYIIATFSFTAYRIRQKLKASSSIKQKSNIVKKRNSFVLLLKLSTTTAISLLPLIFANINIDLRIMMAFLIVAHLSGVYIGIAFVFTRKNYRLLKKKYFPAKKKPVNV